MEEFTDVVNRPKFKKYFSKKEVEKLLKYFDQYGELVDVSSDVLLCRDKKDNFLLNLSVDSKADFLVTGDQDLLILERVEQTKIITLADFFTKLE